MEGILNKKIGKAGQSGSDTILAIVSIFGLGVFTLIIVFTYSAFMDQARSSETFNQSQQAIDAMTKIEEVNTMWDYVILVILIGFAVAMVALGYFIDVNSVFMPFFIIVMLVGLILAGVLSYAWEQIAEHSTFLATKTSNFPITDHLLSNLALYYTAIAALAFIVTYAKTRQGV